MATKLLEVCTLRHVTVYATMLQVDLEKLGGLPGASITIRLAGRSAELILAALKDPTARQTANALGELAKLLDDWGVRRIWYPFPAPFPPAEENFASCGFRRCGTYWRMERDVRDGFGDVGARESGLELRAAPLALSPEAFDEAFGGLACGSPEIQGVRDRAMAVNIMLHEQQWKDQGEEIRQRYFGLFESGRPVAMSAIWVKQRPTGEVAATLTPYFGYGYWKNGSGEKWLRFIAADMGKKVSVTLLGVAVEESQTERLAFYERLGFKKISPFVYLVRERQH
jgi:hypothetical protein